MTKRGYITDPVKCIYMCRVNKKIFKNSKQETILGNIIINSPFTIKLKNSEQ